MVNVVVVLVFLIKVFVAYTQAFYRWLSPNARKDVKDKVVLITGAGRGIGKCMALQFAALGAKLALWDINQAEAQQTAEEITKLGGTAVAYHCDVTKKDNVKRSADKVREDLGHVDILVNNAGIMLLKDFFNLTETDIRRTFDINIISHFWLIGEFLPHMLSINDGHIVTMASMAGKAGCIYMTEYCASKFAAFGFTEALALEIKNIHKKPGVKTTTVCPSFVNTNLVTDHANRISLNTGVDPILQPITVASAIIDSVLRNEVEVYLPRHLNTFDMIRAITPVRVKKLMREASGLKLMPVQEKRD